MNCLIFVIHDLNVYSVHVTKHHDAFSTLVRKLKIEIIKT